MCCNKFALKGGTEYEAMKKRTECKVMKGSNLSRTMLAGGDSLEKRLDKDPLQTCFQRLKYEGGVGTITRKKTKFHHVEKFVLWSSLLLRQSLKIYFICKVWQDSSQINWKNAKILSQQQNKK